MFAEYIQIICLLTCHRVNYSNCKKIKMSIAVYLYVSWSPDNFVIP